MTTLILFLPTLDLRFVAQVAGKLQGLIDGDLGDLGSASLTERQLLHLLDLGINDVVKSFGEDTNIVTVSRKRRQKISNQSVWCPVNDRQQLQLEVVTRLLACAQRLYMSRESWNALDNPDETLGALLKVPSLNRDDEWVDPELPEAQELPIRVSAKSPWMDLVLRKLILPKYGTTTNDEETLKPLENPLSPVLELISNEKTTHESPIPYLALVGASAEFFPAGECWALSATENWHRFLPEDKLRGEVIWCHGSSEFDLISLLSILSKQLEEHGQLESDSGAQYWILLTLTKLTETTAVLVQNSKNLKNSGQNFTSLTTIWRAIWKTLLRSDLRYASFTNLGENSLGEIFVILLTEIISRKCAEIADTNTSLSESRESSFVCEQQRFIWNLLLRKPALFAKVRSRAQFELIISVSKFGGLSDSKRVGESETPLRLELLRLALSSFKEVVMKKNERSLHASDRKHRLIRSIAYCIICLVNGSCPSLPSSTSAASRFYLTKCGDHYSIKEEKKTLMHVMQRENHISLYLMLLWDNKEPPEGDRDLSFIELHSSNFDPPRLVAKRLRDSLQSKERLENYTSNFISESDSEGLRRKVFAFVKDEIPYLSTLAEFSAEFSDGAVVRKGAQTLAVKLNLSLLISQKSLETDLLARIPDIISFFISTVSDLAGSHFESFEYLEIVYDLIQISQTLIEVVTRHPSKVDLSQRMIKPIAECQSLLKQYSCQPNSDDHSFTSNKMVPIPKGEPTDDNPDFDSTDMSLSSGTSPNKTHNGTTKRREPDGSEYDVKRAKRRKTKSSFVTPPNFQCAKAIGSLVIAMEPSFSNCRLVCETLLGTDIDVEPESIKGDMDLNSVVHSVSLLSKREVLLNSLGGHKLLDTEDPEEMSSIVMLCQVIDLVRECAESFSRYFTYGNLDCAKVSVEILKLGLTLTSEEAKLIVGVLSVEDGMRSRFSLRAERAEAATYIFENASDDFHRLFDKFFTNSIVKAGFDDPNFILRRLASVAAGMASFKLDEHRILNSVSNRIAPIFSSTNAEETIGMFTDWYVKSGLSSTEEEDVSSIEAKNSLEAMESDSIFAKALLAGSMCDRKVFIQLLQEISETPVARPGLEFMSYRALEKISFMRGYFDVQELVDLEAESLLAVWLQKTKHKNNDTYTGIFPPSLTSPKAVWYIMLYGRYDYLIQSQFSPDPNEESMDFRIQSTVNFVRRHRAFIVPFTLLKSHDVIGRCKKSNSIIEHLSNDFGFKIVLAMIVSSDKDDSDGIYKILKRHAIAIQTMCVLLVHSDSDSMKKAGQMILGNLAQVLSEKAIELKPNANAPVMRRVLQLAGQARNLYEVMSFSESSYYQSIKHLTSTLGQSQNISGDVFIHAGTSLTEVTICAYDKLAKSKLADHQHHAWSRFVLLGEFLVDQFEDGGEQIQLGFFLHMLNEIVSKNSFQKRIRVQALILVHRVLRESLRLDKTELNREVSPAINRLVGVCFHVHEECQRDLLYDLHQKIRNHKFDLRRSRGFQQHVEACDTKHDHSVSALELVQWIETSSSAQLNHDCLVSTHDILRWIVQNKEVLRLDCCFFAKLSNSIEVEHSGLDTLGEADKRYSAQTLGQGFVEGKKAGTLKQYMSGLKYRKLRSQFLDGQENPIGHTFSRLSCRYATVDERLLCAELSQMENILQDAKMIEVSNSDLSNLLGYLCNIAKTSSSPKVKYALSRCIALLEPSTLLNISCISNTNTASLKSNYDNLQLKLRARCIDSLADLLKSTKTDVAMAAVMALEAILSNDVGRNPSSMVAPTTVSLIKPFVCKGKCGKSNATSLFDGEKRSLMKILGTRDNSGMGVNESFWCWDQTFWSFDKGRAPRFEVWIRRLTSAIIVSCFNPTTKMENDDGKLAKNVENAFFWHCQRIAYLDHVFASTVFPLLILTLLQREKQNNNCDDKNVNGMARLIEKSFGSILLSWIRPDKPIGTAVKNDLRLKSLSIVIDTLDVLRKVSQGRFLSLKHKPNKTINKRNKTINKRTKGEYNVGLDPLVPWQGVSYGVILQMDGIIVAEACMEVRRFASALFFLEMYFNSQYGKSGGLFEELDNAVSCVDVIGEFNGVRSISGANHFFQAKDSGDDDLKARTMKAMSMTSRCYKELGEIELMHATNMQLSSLDFTGNSDSMTVDLDKLRGTSSVDTLQVLGSHSSKTSDLDIGSILSLTNSMEAVRIEGLINTYIEGVFAQNKDLKASVDIQILREKWFENSLETQSWSRLSGDLSKNAVRGLSVTPLGSSSNRGYFEFVSESLNSLWNSDMISFKLSLEQAHSCVISSLSSITGESVSPEKLVEIVDKLRALQDVGRLNEDKVDLSTFEFNEIWILKTSSKIRQITLTSIASKYPGKKKVIKFLRDHLWKTCDCAVYNGRPQIAETALSKLKQLLNLPIERHDLSENKSDEILRIRLEEAKIMECRGDFNGAIQRSKQLIRHIGDRNSNKIQKCLLCDAQILCGSWMTKYKTQQAREILEKYLNPAANRAKYIYEDENTIANAERATRVFIKLGHKLANLHDDLLSRINGKEWEETETRLQYQHQQCLNSVEHRRELKREFEKLKKSNPRREEAYKHWKETEGHFVRLEKEYKNTTKERSGIKRLVPHYLHHALKAFLSAFEMAGTSSNDLSSNIFRMISLWFSCQKDTANDTTANDVMEEGLCKVPSYRFVTLTNQLFSRIDTKEGINDQKFQVALQSLVFRMCNDHPYHCIASLIALKNGNVVSKKRGVQQIIDEIDKSGIRYVKDLLRSYRILVSAYNDLAHASTTKYQGSSQQRRKKIKFSELFPSAAKKSLDRCLSRLPGVPCVITSPPPLRPGKDYGCGREDPIGGERIAGFEPDFSITESGIHRPKIVMCTGSKGGSFRQLVKGEDDIRQDAIMSQVFTYVNNLMKKRTNSSVSNDDPRTLKGFSGHTRRRLNMITYYVLPLSPSSGVSQTGALLYSLVFC